MPKNPNSSTKPVKREGPMNATMKFFLAGCVAELYLLVVRKYYVNGTLTQVIAWDSYLRYILWAGLAVLAIGVILSIVWNKDRKNGSLAGLWAVPVRFCVFLLVYTRLCGCGTAADVRSGPGGDAAGYSLESV